jgi:hypothetical protein
MCDDRGDTPVNREAKRCDRSADANRSIVKKRCAIDGEAIQRSIVKKRCATIAIQSVNREATMRSIVKRQSVNREAIRCAIDREETTVNRSDNQLQS